ncbi:hypothetical protein MC885_020387, partial [Smutsia gigantea]
MLKELLSSRLANSKTWAKESTILFSSGVLHQQEAILTSLALGLLQPPLAAATLLCQVTLALCPVLLLQRCKASSWK